MAAMAGLPPGIIVVSTYGCARACLTARYALGNRCVYAVLRVFFPNTAKLAGIGAATVITADRKPVRDDASSTAIAGRCDGALCGNAVTSVGRSVRATAPDGARWSRRLPMHKCAAKCIGV